MADPWSNSKIVTPASPWANSRIVASTPGTGPKPASGYAPAGAPVSRQTYIPGGNEDPATIAAQAAARAGAVSGVETQQQLRLLYARQNAEYLNRLRENSLPPNPNQKFDNVTGMRKELENTNAVKVYKSAVPSYVSALSAPDTTAGDLDMIYAYAKIMDPNSVVREGEANSVSDLGSYGQQIYGQLRKQLDGSGRLPPDQRAQMRIDLANRVGQYNTAYKFERARFTDLAKKQGIDPDLVVGPHFGDPYASVENQYFRGDPNKGAAAVAAQPAQPTDGGGSSTTGGGDIPGAPGPGGAPGGGQPPMPPEQLAAQLRQMFNDGRPAAEIMAFAKQASGGGEFSKEDQAAIADYDRARVAGQPTQIGVRAPPGTSTMAGFAEGVMKPLDRAAVGLQNGVNWLTGNNFQSASQAAAGRDAAIRTNLGVPDPTARTIGESASILPLLALPGGAITQGAVGNVLLGDSNTKAGIAKDAILGGMFGKMGDVALRTAAGVISPSLRQEVQNLTQRGVRLTPGRIFGGKLQNIEDRATSLPAVGPRIVEGNQNALGDWNLSMANDVLAPTGQTIPAGVAPGHPAVRYVHDTLSQGYKDATANISAQLDPTFATRWNAIQQRAKLDGLPAAQTDELNEIFNRDVGGAFAPGRGMFGGRSYKRLDERLGDLATSYGRSDDPYQRQLGDFVSRLNDQVGALVRRQNPAQAAQLRGLDDAWSRYVRLRDAASRAVDDGIATPSQWETAVRMTDKSLGKGRTAEGRAMFQGPVSDAAEVLPSRLGNSGTTDRENLTDTKAWIAGLLASPLYSESAQRIMQGLLTAPRPVAAKPVAEFIKSLPAGILAPPLIPSRN